MAGSTTSILSEPKSEVESFLALQPKKEAINAYILKYCAYAVEAAELTDLQDQVFVTSSQAKDLHLVASI